MQQTQREIIADSIINTLGMVGALGLCKESYAQYQDDPVRFGEEVLGHDYPIGVKNLLRSVRDYPVTIAQSCNAYGKTFAAADAAVWFYKTFPNSQVFTAAAPPEDNLKRLLWGQLGNLVQKNPQLFESDKINILEIKRSPDSYLVGVTIPATGTSQEREARFSGKHAANLMFIFDEADAIPDEVYKGAESCSSGGRVRWLLMFNPRAEMGEAYRMVRDGRANVVHLSAFDHPNVVSGKDLFPGAVTRDKTVLRICKWCRPLRDDQKKDPAKTFELPKYLEGAVTLDEANNPTAPLLPGWYEIIMPAFSYMVLGQYPAQGTNQLISREWINMARTRWELHISKWGEKPPADVTGVMGLDAAEMGDCENVAMFRWGGYVSRPTVWGGVDMYVTGDKATAVYNGNPRITLANVDANGVGAGVAPHMRRLGCNANGVKVSEKPTKTSEMGEFGNIRDQLWWMAREHLRLDPGAMLPPDEQLLEELTTPTYEVRNGKIKVMSKDDMKLALNRSPDKADAYCLTFAESPAIKPAGGAPVIHKSGYVYRWPFNPIPPTSTSQYRRQPRQVVSAGKRSGL
jgi:hypothetical protein